MKLTEAVSSKCDTVREWYETVYVVLTMKQNMTGYRFKLGVIQCHKGPMGILCLKS